MISEIFKPGGALESGLQGYEERPEQERMARAVAQIFGRGGSLLVEAGTGTGKSLAYLIPALYSDLQVIISTGTRSLQDQLLNKDLPVLQQIVDKSFTVTALKGTSNYLCRRKYSAWYAQLQLPDSHSHLVEEWAQSTENGDRAELSSIPENAPIWSQLTTSSETRLGPRCPYYETCFVTKARRKAEHADLVIVNHHLFFSDLALQSESDGARILPEYQAVVFDEAHGLEEVMTEHFGVAIGVSMMESLVRDWKHQLSLQKTNSHAALWMPKQGELLAQNLAGSSQRFFAAIRRKIGPLLAQDAALATDGERFTLPDSLIDDTLKEAWLSLDTALEELYAHGQRCSEDMRDEGEDISSEVLRALARRSQRFRNNLAAIADQKLGQGDYVFWGQIQGKAVSLHASPIGVDEVLEKELLSKVHSSVFTSATLSTGGQFTHIRSRLGLHSDATEELRVESPFDYQKQCVVYLPRDIPDPRNVEKQNERYAHMVKILDITNGYAFILFTSYRAMHQCHKAMAKLIPYPLLVQGQAPRAALLETFHQTPHAVLLATSSFWEGVDVPGQALSQVLIDKLPFDVPTDPLNVARMTRLELEGASAFENYQLPRAAIAFKQGFGRLIRHRNDRGIVSVLDPRIVTKRYGRYFLESLPPVSRTSSLEQVRRWWKA